MRSGTPLLIVCWIFLILGHPQFYDKCRPISVLVDLPLILTIKTKLMRSAIEQNSTYESITSISTMSATNWFCSKPLAFQIGKSRCLGQPKSWTVVTDFGQIVTQFFGVTKPIAGRDDAELWQKAARCSILALTLFRKGTVSQWPKHVHVYVCLYMRGSRSVYV